MALSVASSGRGSSSLGKMEDARDINIAFSSHWRSALRLTSLLAYSRDLETRQASIAEEFDGVYLHWRRMVVEWKGLQCLIPRHETHTILVLKIIILQRFVISLMLPMMGFKVDKVLVGNKMHSSFECHPSSLHMNFMMLYLSINFRGTLIGILQARRFRFVLSPQPTPATSLYLRRRCQWADEEEIAKLEQIEVCPKALELTHRIAKRISVDGGGALIIDYGKNEVIADSLQAIQKHKFVNILDSPGSADLSAYVDFAAIRHSAQAASENISVHGPITQSQLLASLGINFRVEALLRSCTNLQAESLRTGYWRLVGDGEAPFWEGPEEQTPIGTGTRYLAMAIVNKKQGVPIPFE
ncbi:hypothetical protein HPP92_022944 [Vanilla planifolia]|uniref:Protein arginine methyltransferase NDUFAF7 n=1 Tax=Vanilla planifolia TaxID=51239 RepID=A0A835PUI0_VANPL|nr:hypothetical protein HPP92_022944 [Vanilla planifolia]